MRTLVRSFDALVETQPLLADGVVFEHDGPRARARAHFAAGWLERFAQRTPMVLVIDEAQLAGPFVTELVAQLSSAPSPILIVLSGAPVRVEAFAVVGDRLAGPLGAIASSPVPAFGLPAGDVGALAGFLATAMPTTLFTRRHLEQSCRAIGATASPQELLDALIAEQWVRVIDEPVFAFVDDEHLLAARDAALGMFENAIDDVCVRLTSAVLRVTGREHLVERTVASRAAAAWDDSPTSDIAFETARLLALQGDVAGALALSAAGSDLLRHAVIAGWEQSLGQRFATPDDFPSERPLSAETLAVQAAVLAQRHPDAARAKLARAIERLQPLALDDASKYDADVRVRCAIARIGLTLGDLDAVEAGLGTNGRALLTERTNGEIDRLGQWRWHRGCRVTLYGGDVRCPRHRAAVRGEP